MFWKHKKLMLEDKNIFEELYDEEVDEYFDLLNTNTLSFEELLEQESNVFGCDLDCSNCPDVRWCEQNN